MGNITWHDYLFGVMTICLVLCVSRQDVPALYVRSAETLQLLRGARSVCLERSVRNKDSAKVQRVINATLLHCGGFGNQNDEDTINGSDLSMVSFDSSLGQFQFPVNQVGVHDAVPQHCLEDSQPKQTEIDGAGGGILAGPMDDASWAYLDQFLNLSNNDLMPSA